MHRFFVPQANIKDKKVHITDKNELKHMERVLRLGIGDKAIIFDGNGKEYAVTITELNKTSCFADIDTEIIDLDTSNLKLTLVQGIAKGDKMDTIVQKAVEVGVKSIYPVLTEHSVVKLDNEKRLNKVQRWQNIAIGACKQCRRNIIPQVYPVTTMAEVMPILADKQGIMLYEGECDFSLKEYLQAKRPEGELFIVVGPEGGFSEKEVAMAKEHGIPTVKMGEGIFRTETAGLVGAAIILYECGDLG